MAERDEHQAIEHVIARLAERFPTLSDEHVRQVVDEELHRLDANPVRDFIPVLVEHAATERLREEAAPVSTPVDDRAAAAAVTDDPPELDPMEIERREREARGGFLFGDLGGGPS